MLTDDQGKGDDDDQDSDSTPTDTGDKPAPQGPEDIEVRGFKLNNDDQEELDLQQQKLQGEVITPSGDVWEPPATDDTQE